MAQKIFSTFGILVLAAVFAYSAYTKLQATEYFELFLVQEYLSNWFLSPYVARLVISWEFFLAILLAAHYRISKLTAPLVLITLVGFTLVLVAQILFNANGMGNCNCFGQEIFFTPAQAIIRNALLIILCLLIRRSNVFSFVNIKTKIAGLVFLPVLLVVCILNPPFNIYEKNYYNKVEAGNAFPESDSLPQEIYTGRKIVALLSPYCDHCKQTAMKLSMASDRIGEMPEVILIYGGTEKDAKEKMKDINSELEHYSIEMAELIKITGGSVPQIFVLQDGVVKHYFDKEDLFQLTGEELRDL